MLAILEFLVWLFLLPYVLFGFVLGMVATSIAEAFEPHVLLASAWLGGLGLYLMPRRMPDDREFVGLVDALAQSHIIGISTPMAMLIGAALLLVVAAATAACCRLRRGID